MCWMRFFPTDALMVRWLRTTFSLGGGLWPSLRLAWHVLRTEGLGGIAWRLENARNISQGRVDPWQRLVLQAPKSQPFPRERFERLWSGQDDSLAADLHLLLNSSNQAAARVAVWTLGRWYARHGRWMQAYDVLQPAMARDVSMMPLGIKLLWVDALRHTGRAAEALVFLDATSSLDEMLKRTNDLDLARVNVLRSLPGQDQEQTSALWLDKVNVCLEAQGLAPLAWVEPGSLPHLDRLKTVPVVPVTGGPLVSVVVPAYNCAATLPTVLRSLIAQSWQALEVLVVDDCSIDDTVAVAERFAAQDGRVRVLRLAKNSGAYEARNTGVEHAQGDFITVHDSDDWSHAEKIERQVSALLDAPDKLVSFSHWVRVSEDLVFGNWISMDSWVRMVHRNTSSMMLRRAAFERLGWWDGVRCSADAEYYHRALRVFGVQALIEVSPGTPLSFGRTHEASLTQSSDTHLFTLFGGLRREYHDAFEQWHLGFDRNDPQSLYMPRSPSERPFPVPEGMLPRTVAFTGRKAS